MSNYTPGKADQSPTTWGEAIIPFCDRWAESGLERAPDTEQLAYVAQELRRLMRDGAPVLRAVLASPYPEVRFHGVQLLGGHSLPPDSEADSDATSLVLPSVRLALVPPEVLDWTDPDTGKTAKARAVPPNTDADGRLLPPERRGKVLVVKVGNRGGEVAPSAPVARAEQYSAPNRRRAQLAGKSLYHTVEITRTPRAIPLAAAVVVLRAWGWGVNPQVWRLPKKTAVQSPWLPGQCQWLVYEVPEAPAGAGAPTE